MSTIDINDLPLEPDSYLDSDITNKGLFFLEDSSEQEIALGDWVDVSPSVFSPDPEWGFSFQVVGIDENAQQVTILVGNPITGVYEQTNVSSSAITNSFRHVPRERLE